MDVDGLEAPPDRRGRERMLRRALIPLLVVAAVLWSPLGRALPFGQGAGAESLDQPTPREATSDRPLGVPVAAPTGHAPHEFLAMQAGIDRPVAYDPCRPITVVVNPRTAPTAADQLLAGALDAVSGITGLRFELEGTTDEPPSDHRPLFQPFRYGDRWAPVLVAWSDPEEQPELRGNVAGRAGSTAIEHGSGLDVYVSGSVMLDGPQLTAMLSEPAGWARAQSVVLHELGHVIGLAHVEDPRQLMSEGPSDVTGFQDGDIAGLVVLGGGACFRKL